MKKFFGSFLLLMIFLSCKNDFRELDRDAALEKEKSSILADIATANGLEHFSQVRELNYTFNVEIKDSMVSQRSWTWKPQEQKVTMTEGGTATTYDYRQQAEQYPKVDHKFINDQYWLLFPYHLVWDDLEFEYHEKATAPISGTELQHVVISYPQDAGYTPGDIYEIYFDDDNIIREWKYRARGRNENPLVTTWEDYQEFNGINISTMHRTPDGTFQLFFTDISVK